MSEGPGSGDGWAVSSLQELGEGPGFRKVRESVGLTEFGTNAIVLPPRWETGAHFHDEQQELYFVHRGPVEFSFAEGPWVSLPDGGVARVDASTPRRMRNPGESEAVVLISGARGGYVGRDGHMLEGEARAGGPIDGDGP
ncbi:MAG: cupin domain-containing protein [Solirubrobacterales bacterium]